MTRRRDASASGAFSRTWAPQPVRLECPGVDVIIFGGCGHVGLPLGLALADAGLHVSLFDTNDAAVQTVHSGRMPHREAGAQEVLERTLASGSITATSDRARSSPPSV